MNTEIQNEVKKVNDLHSPFKYDRTPYLCEIMDCIMSDDPPKYITVMKGSSLGSSTAPLKVVK